MKEGWTYKRLGDICDFEGGSQPPKSEWINCPREGYIRMLQIRDFTLSRMAEVEYVKITKRIKLCKCNDILLGRYGASIGKVLYGLEGAYNVALMKAIPNEELILKRYIRYYFESNSFQGLLKKVSSTRAAQGGFSKEDIADERLLVPPLSEQERIVALLDDQFAKIDALKANTELQLLAAKDLFQSALKEYLTPKEGWEMKSLEELATDMYRGSGITREQIRENGISCVRYGEIYTTYNYWFDKCASHTDESLIKSPKFFEHGDILFTITGESVEDIAKSVAYLGDEKCLAGGDIVVMKHKQNAKYLSYALSTPDAIRQKGLGKTKLKVVHSNVPSIKAIVVPIPDLEIQQQIADILDTLSDKVARLQANYDQTINLCNDLKQSLLKSIFE